MESVRPKRTAKLPARLLDTDIQVEIQKVAEEITSLQSSLTTTPEGQGRARPVVSPASSLTETPEGQDRGRPVTSPPSTVPLAEEDALEKERTALLEEIRILELAKEVEDLRRRKVQLQFRSTARREFNPPPAEASPSAPTGPGREGQGLAWSIDVESAKDKSVKDRPGLSQDQAVTHDAASPHDVARTIQDLRRDSAAVAEVDRILGAMSLQPAPVLPLPDPGKLSLPDPSVQPVRQNPGLGLPAANPSVPPAQTNSGLSSAPPTEQPAKPSPNPLVAPKPSVQPTDQRGKQKLTSGFFRTPRSSSRIEKNLIWPQEELPAFSSDSGKLTYPVLNWDQFLAGYMKLFTSELLGSVELRERLKLVQQCAEYKLRYPWAPAIRDFHGEVLRAVERGEFDWGDSGYKDHVEHMYRLHVQPHLQCNTTPKTQRPSQSQSQLQETLKYCKLFQSQSCPLSEIIHEDEQFGEVHHICANCLNQHNEAAYDHGASDCNRKGRRGRSATGKQA